MNAMHNAQCTMHNSGMRTGAQGRRKARLGWAAAVVIAAAGTLLGGARDAWAFTWNGGRFYFDATGWGQTYVQMMVGHSSYSDCYTMTQIGTSGIYYVDVSKWNDATHFAFIGNSSQWGSEGKSIDARLSYATKRTASYNGSYTFNSGANYLFQKASADNGATISPVYIGDNGFTSVTTPQLVDWYDGSGSSSGNWEQSGYTLWWYNGNSGFRWVNVTNFGAQHVRINNNAIATSQTVTENTTVASLTFGSSATKAHTLAASSGKKLTINGGITNAYATNTISAPVVLGANTTVDVSGGILKISGAITGSSKSLTKKGSKQLTLSGSNSYSGGTTVSAGTLRVENYSAIPGDVANNGVLVFNVNGNGTFSGAISGSGSLEKLYTSRTLTLTGNNSYSGGTTITAGTLQVGDGGTSGVLPGNVTNNAALIFNRSDAVSFGGVISGTGTLNKKAAGTLTLSGTSTMSGATTVEAGTLKLTGTLANSAVTVSGGTLEAGSANRTVKGLTLSGGTLKVAAGASIRLSSGGTGATLTSGTIAFDASSATLGDSPWVVIDGDTNSQSVGDPSGLTFTVTAKAGTSTGDYVLYKSGKNILVKYQPAQTVTAAATLTLYAGGEDGDLEAETDGDGGLTYSGYSAIVTVDSEGKVTPVAYGTTTITITAAETASYAEGTAECEVTVRAAKPSGSGSITAHGAGTAVGSFTVSYTKGDGEYAVLLAKEGADPTAPTDGQGADRVATGGKTWAQALAYPEGSSDGTKAIVHSTTSPGTQTITGATPGAAYHLALYSRNPDTYASADRKYFSYSETPDTVTVYTKSTEPTGAPSITAPAADNDETDGSTSTTIELTKGAFTGASGETSVVGTLLILVQGNSASGVIAPTDGTAYMEGATALGGTIVYMGTGTEAPIRNLTQNTTYTVVAYSYAMVAGAPDTVNYYTTSRAERIFKTKVSTAPSSILATGVDADQFLLNWNQPSGATKYDVQWKASGGASYAPRYRIVFTNSFASGDGWTSQLSYNAKTDGYIRGRLWTFGGTSANSVTVYYSGTETGGDTGYVYLPAQNNYLVLPDMYGPISAVRVRWRTYGGARKLTLSSYSGTSFTASSKTINTANTTDTSTWEFATPITGPVRFKINNDGLYNSIGTGNSVDIDLIEVLGPQYGHSDSFEGLSSGTYLAQVGQAGQNDYSDDLSVKTGVVPSAVDDVDQTSDSVTFEWTGHADAVGYIVDASLTNVAAAGASWTTKSPGTSLGFVTVAGWGGNEWCYTNANNATVSGSGSLSTAPSYKSGDYAGHHLGGTAGNTLMSTNFPIGGASEVKLQFTVGGWNTSYNSSSKLDWAEVDVFYRLDDGPWCYMGYGVPTARGDGNLAENLTFIVPQGGLDGTNIAFKLTAPYATKVGGYIAGPYVKNITVTRTMPTPTADYGYYGTNSLAGYPKLALGANDAVLSGSGTKSHTVAGLPSEKTVYFRVQALQGSTATPTAKSVWVAGKGATTAFAGPTGVSIDGTGRYSLTVGWDEYDGEDAGDYDISYTVELTGCAEPGAEGTPEESCPAENLDWGSSSSAWTYQRATSGSKKGDYPKYEGGVHKVWAQYGTMSTRPAILSPVMDLSGYARATVDFTHMFVNHALHSEVVVSYSLNGGSTWVAVETTGVAAGYTLATASGQSIELPAEARVDGVKIKVELNTSAASYDGYTKCEGASIVGLQVTGYGEGGGNYDSLTCDSVQSETVEEGDWEGDRPNYTFEDLEPGKTYYVHVQTVLSGVQSEWTEVVGTTAAPQAAPEAVWAEDIRQKHFTLTWDAAEGATTATKYKYEVTSCSTGSKTVEAVSPSPTEQDITAEDDWSYVGGGTPPSSQQVDTYGIVREAYPAWCNEGTLVLAGEGNPGLESKEFSTVAATAVEVTFYHGRWYTPQDSTANGAVTVSYSLDGGDNWVPLTPTAYSDLGPDASSLKRTIALPAAARGQPSVKVRLEAKSAGLRSTDSVPVGCAIGSAKVTVTRPGGDFSSGCIVERNAAALSWDQLSAEIGNTSTLSPGTVYYFRVAASDGVQYGDWTEGVTKTLAAPDAPGAPTQLSAGRHSLTMTWNAVAGAETYTLYRYTNGSGAGETVVQSGIEGTTYTLTGLDGNTTYYFKVEAHADGTYSAKSGMGSGTTAAALTAPRIVATNILETSMRLKWDYVSGTTYTLSFGAATDGAGTDAYSYAEVIECPAETLGRSDKANGWFYIGGNATYPKYYNGGGNDHGHVLAYKDKAGEPGIQSRWFSTYGARSAALEFLHGKFGNGGANSALDAYYSVDGGVNWTKFGSAPSTTAAAPTVERSIPLPAAALGRRSVMVRLVAPDAVSGNAYGAEIQGLKMVVDTGKSSATPIFSQTLTTAQASQGYMDFSSLAAGTRYWFTLTAAESGDSETTRSSAATRTRTTGAVLSQGFEGASGNGGLDATSKAWGYSTSWKYVSGGGDASAAAGKPTVGVVDGVNPLYGDRALRMSGSAGATVYGVVDFDNFSAGAGSSLTVTIPFAAQDLGKNDYLYVAYCTDGSGSSASSWHAPAGTTAVTTMGGVEMGRIGVGGSDVLNQNWPYNRGVNTTTRPQGDAFTFTVDSVSQLKLRLAFCGQSGGANHYYWIDEVKLTRNPGDVQSATATAQESGGILLSWTPPAGGSQGVVILRGRDERHIPAGPLDLDNLPHGYEIVMNGDSKYWPPATTSFTDTEVLSGWRYFYYFYGAIDNEDGSYMLRSTPLTANDVVLGMVNAIASQGWDGWDVHPWGYTKGRVTNPGDGDAGYWADHGQGVGKKVQFIDPSKNSGNPTWEVNSAYTTLYGSNQQLDVMPRSNYYGTNSFRLSGGGGATYNGQTITTNNAAIQFDNIDLSGYKNVEFSLHFAAHTGTGGDDMHVAISTNGGTEWLPVSRTNAAMWKAGGPGYHYGIKVGDGNLSNGGTWGFYYEDYNVYKYWYNDQWVYQVPTPEGNPYWLRVPDSVTQFMARVMFYDSNGGSRRDYSYYIDEVRLVGEEALRTPHPVMENIESNRFTVRWDAIPDATSYDVKVTKCAAAGDDAVKLTQAFVLSVVSNGWTTSESGTTLTKTGDHTGRGYGLTMGAPGAMLTSPEVGAARTVTFWSKAVSENANSKLLVQVSEDGTNWETLTNYTAATTSGATTIGKDDWVQKTVDLPHRQWSRVRFRMERTSGSKGNFYLDDINILGGGDYEGASCVVATAHVTSGTSVDFANGVGGVTLTPGTPYYVEVMANGAPGGYLTHSPWGETGDYTPGTVTMRPDGFEMVRMWGTASSDVNVLIASSAGDDPIGSPAAGATYSAGDALPGGGTVIARWTSDDYTENANFEHVVPPGAQVNYAVFWKRGSYYEGRYATNFWMGQYGSDAAEAFAQTNGTDAGAATWTPAGSGFSGNWIVASNGITWMCAEATRNASQPFGLLGTNQLYGAGGNMLALYPGNSAGARSVSVTRELETAFGAGEMWWGMFTMKATRSAANSWSGLQLLDASGNVKASIGSLWDGAKLGIEGKQGSTTKKYSSDFTITGGSTYLIIFLWDNANNKMLTAAYTVTAGTSPILSASTPAPGQTGGTSWQVTDAYIDMSDIKKVRFVAQNSASEYVDNVYFDEFRMGPTWDSLIKEPAPPRPVTSARAIPDGKELVRLDWTYGSSDGDHPAATGVLVLDKATAWTAADIEAIKPVNGQRYTAGQSVGAATVAYLGGAGWTVGTTQYQDLVVDPGTTHYFHFFAHSGYIYTNGVAASGTAPSRYPVTMETYRTGEHVVPFSYTNATTAVESWQGGAGFTGGWTGTGTWTAKLPLEQPGSNPSSDPVLADVTGYPARAGNAVMVTDPGDGGRATLTRALDTAVTASQTNFYAAFMMAYEWKGANKWAGVSILNGSDQEIGFAGKGSGANWNTLAVASDLTPHWSQTDLLPYDPGNADSSGALDHAYLVVMRYNFANRTLSALAVPCGGEMPEYEPTQWDVSWQVREGLGSSVAKIQLNVGSAAGGTIGYCWFDELRWGTRWDDIVSGKCADGVDVAEWRVPGTETALTQTYLGNSADIGVKSHPKGFGQEAWLTVDWSGDGTGVVTNQLEWMKNIESGTPTYTWWSNTVQMVKTGKVGGSSSVDYPATAKLTALNTDCETTRTVTQVTVLALQPPTGVSAAKDAVKTNSVINVNWTPWQGTLTGVDTHRKDVLIVRFSGATEAAALAKAALAANQPVQGRAYSAGDSIGEGTVVWRGGDEGAVTTAAARGLQPETCYAFAVYTENYSYYSTAAYASATTDEGGHDITVNGDPTDWYGEAPDTLNTAWVNLGEFIWKDKTGEERHSAGGGGSTVGNPNSDIDEFRIYADADWVYFLVKMTNITDVAKPYVAVGVDSRKKASSEAMNWLGDESATTIGSNYWANTGNEHYPRWQLNVHQVAGQGTQVEQYAADGSEWYAPVGTVTTTEGGTPVTRGWAAAIGSGVGQAVEFRVARSDIGLAGIEDGAAVTQRFTVASFVNTGVWNNQGGATAEIYGGTSKAVDALGIAPQRPASKPDNDYLLSSWDEDIADGNIDFWVDVAFSKSGVVENQRPSAPSQLVFPTEDARLKSSPTFEWKRGSDTDGKVTGYMLEVSTNADFNDLNGTVELRVNVPALVTGETDSTKYHYAWSGAHQQTMYYWRVRSRDTGGMLSTPASGQFWVDEDGDGPVAVLKYVGVDVAGYMAGNYAQQEKLWPESLLSVTDADIERVVDDPSLKFGFVIEWSDPNGVYATNHMHDGAGDSKKGKWAWNIASGDGRVSPNWDLVEFHTTLTDRSADTNSFAGLVTDVTGHGEWTTNYWDETGCWGYQWGYDEAFRVGTAGTTDDQTRGANGDSVITNLVRSAFDMHAFDTNVDYYLTVSAEDCTTWKESGSDWWEYGTWKSFKDPSDPDAPGSRYSSGWCADGPNRARNVTTNQLLEIRVRDNDVTAPGASLNRWSTTSFIASTNDATPTFANPEKQLTRESGTGLPTYVTTDGELAGRPLALHFNVYDSSMTGIKLGTAETETVAGLVGSHTMTNSWLVRTQQVGDAEPDVMTNRANYAAAKSTLESSGTGAGTVLTWYWPTMDAENIAHFWATNAVGEGGVLTETVNTLALNLWDLDNNRDGDQMGAETVMGYLKVRDDDTSAPVARDMHTLGTGTNRVVFGLLARWPMATNEATNGRKCTTINEMLSGAVVDNGLSGSGHGTLTFYPSYSMWGYSGIRLGNQQRAVKFPLTAATNGQWESEALSFTFRTTHGGPTNLTVTVQMGSGEETTLGTIQVEKELDANGDHADTTTDVTVLFAGADKVTCLAGQTATFRVYADGLETDSSAAQFGEFKVYGVVSLPPGTEVTDQDMRTATWTNSVDVSDGAQGKTDTLRSGLWLAHSAAYTGAAADEPLPKYVLEDASTHEAITNGLTVSGLTAAFENEVADGDFETDFTSPGSEWSLGGGAAQVTDATGGNHVLKFTANGASATKVLDLGDVTGATAIRAKCDQVEYKGGRVRLTYVWLDEDGDEVEAESAAHSTANNGWEIWVPRNQSVSAANLEAGTVRQLEVTFTREDSSNEADLDDIEVYAEVVTAGGTRTVPATPAVDDFESGTSGWELSDGASVELGGAIRTGSYAVEVSATTDVVKNWVAVTAAEGLQQGSMLGSVWTRGAAAAVEVRFFKTEAETTPLTPWLTVDVPATVDWARTDIPATSTNLTETGLNTVYGLVRVRGGGSGATFVDDLEMIVVGWGTPTAGATAENGTKSAALQFTTGDLVDGSGKLSLPGGVATLPKDYNFGVQVADYDLDRTQDHLVTTSSGSFRLYDDDATAPQAGMMFGGSLGVRTGDAKAPYAGLGTDVDVRLSDGAMVAAGSSAQVAFDLDFYDYSGWDTLGLSWYPATEAGGAHTLVWTNGSGSMASARKTKGDGEANSPSATNTVTVPVSTLWGLSAVQDAFTTGIVSNWMAATITDKDADRDGDELVWTNKVGMLTFLDDDVKAPKLGSTNRWPRQMFVGKGSVSALKNATNNYADYRRPYWPLGTTYEDHVPACERTTVVYDGELRTLATENLFIEVDMNDPSDSMKGRSATGLRRGTAKTVTGQANGLGDTYTTTNTWLGLFVESGTNASSYASAEPVIDATVKYSSADETAEDHTKGSLGVMWNVWKWTENLTPEAVAAWLPSGSAYRDLRAVVHAYDADTDRPGDQLESVLVGQVIRVRDDDTVAPGTVGDIMNNGVNITYTGSTLPSRTDPSVKWTNNLSSMTLTFTAATDGAKGADDLNVSGIGGYRLADATPAAATDGTALACTVSEGTVTANLGDSDVTQGLTAEYVFAVDADDDRPGDALAGTAKGFVLAYDATPPPEIGTSGTSTNTHLVAAESTDDPTSQFDLRWPTMVGDSGDVQLGPDDTTHPNHPTKRAADYDYLSPWATYKIYYGTFDETAVPAGDIAFNDTGYIYTNFVKTGAYTNWNFVTTNSTSVDPGAGANPYRSLGAVSNAVDNNHQKIRLYDLDFDQHYVVVIVGVDRAGNEGPAGKFSWATNNTIKFAVTQGVVRASADVNTMLASANLADVGMAKIDTNARPRAAVLFWKAAGQKDASGNVTNVTKNYDLIYRDAASFDELGTEQWKKASTTTNSGTSKTNWNYQADGLALTNTLRFFRASYKDRWQDTKQGGEKQTPLASEEVYSMNNIVVSEGYNFVSLQGTPWTNTFEGVFGTDTNMWPGGESASDTNATQVAFFEPGTTQTTNEWFYFGKDGEWHDSAMGVVTTNQQREGFFARPFSLTLPQSNAWWDAHGDYEGAKASKSKSVKAMLWHPIMQVPTTNGPAAGGFSHTIVASNGHYNLLSLNLPVAVHPRKLRLEDAGLTKNDNPWDADKLYVVDTATKEVRGGSMMYCTSSNTWQFVNGGSVPEGFIKPNDMLVLISATNGTDWTWTYHPTNFYKLPTRHMGRTP